MSKRVPSAPAGPKSPNDLSPTIIIADNVSLTGIHLITIGGDTVIHPRVKLDSLHAPVTFGRTCIVGERSLVGLQSTSDNQPEGVVIEDGVIIEVGAVVEARRVGGGSLIEVNARIMKGASIGKHCKIGPLCSVAENEVIPDFTVVYGEGLRRVDKSGTEELKMKMVRQQVEVLRKLLPNHLAKHQG